MTLQTSPTSRPDAGAATTAQPAAGPTGTAADRLRRTTPPARARRRRLGPGRPLPLGWAYGPVLLVAVWSIGSAAGLIDPRSLSAPWTVVTTAGELIAEGRLQEHLAASAQRALLGLLFGVAAGTVLAVVSGLSRLGEAIIDGPVQIKRAIPSLALIPLLVLWFGIGESMKVITIALGVLIPIYIHTHNALRSIDSRYVELAETVGLDRAGFVRHVVLPGALPGFLLGLRFAATAAWLALVVVEQVNATSGIGYMMELARTYGQTDVILVGLVVYGLLGLVSDGLVRLVQRRALSWRRTLAD
ncbi:ABC transporter permease [Allostreptomyces psammosilenae]|uniref:Sulfonate transport system permease protein n=1 Tax=Allostreptomyces psammosilenae TaxID=1892865 RepID=A0A853A163_9ACTN|nr:ABC transporter permease [Allostreptomyces psammosilenae]NYI04242.1 sulfonate transport system permease protein [Allostreptomyces psammosilenae]